jgi:hypothetical protein
MLMAGPLGGAAGGSLEALPVGPTAFTTEFEDDIDGGPPEALPAGPTASTTEFKDDVDGGAPGERCR